MPTEYGGVECPKPQKAQRTRARAKRHESKVASEVRAQCVLRDGDCRLMKGGGWLGTVCGGESEWCHLGDMRRFRTRGMEAEARHTTQGTCCLCTNHHRMLDANEIRVEFVTPHGADSTLRFVRGAISVLSVPRTQP